MLSLALLPVLFAASQVAAFNCETHTFTQCADNIVHWYDPDDGMICDPLDCGGGRAPVKYDVPCCAAYTGTAECVTSASYLPCFKDFAQSTLYSSMAEPTSSPEASTTAESSAVPSPTEAASSESDQPVPTGQTSEGSTTANAPTTTQPPTGAMTLSKGPIGTGTTASTGGSGNATLSSAPAPSPTLSEGAAGTLRFDALVAMAGALIALM